MNYQSMKIEDIIKWCQENNQVEWLKAEMEKETECEVYPRKKITTEDGKKISVADKTQKPTIEMRPISFIQVKLDFVEKFMPEIAPKKKEKKLNMYELVKSL